jgi:hypothetical protein
VSRLGWRAKILQRKATRAPSIGATGTGEPVSVLPYRSRALVLTTGRYKKSSTGCRAVRESRQQLVSSGTRAGEAIGLARLSCSGWTSGHEERQAALAPSAASGRAAVPVSSAAARSGGDWPSADPGLHRVT